MSDSRFEFEITIRSGESVRRVPVASLAAVFRVPVADARTALAILAYGPNVPVDNVDASKKSDVRDPACDPSDGDSPRDTLEAHEGNDRSETFRENISSERYVPNERSIDARTRARELAIQLDDVANVAAIEQLVRMHARDTIDEALGRTLAIPSERIRKSRGAAFTAIVRILAEEKRIARDQSPESHARTQTSTT